MAKYREIELKSGKMINLTESEIFFVEYYLADPKRNATQAALKAGYSKKNTNRLAAQLLSKLDIQSYIQDKTLPILDALGATQERLMQEWVALGLSRIDDYMFPDYSMKPLSQINKNSIGAMESVKITEKVLMQPSDGEEDVGMVLEKKTEFKLHDKIKSLTILSEMQGLIKKSDAQPVSAGTINLNQQINNYYKSKE